MKSYRDSPAEPNIEVGKTKPIWLDADEPPAFELLNAGGKNSLILIADHASNRVPRCLQQLGLDSGSLTSHIAWDAGSALVAKHLSDLLDAPLLMTNYSRLVIDCNRDAGSEQAIVESSDGTDIPGNAHLDSTHIASRKHILFDPYHLAIEGLLDARNDRPHTLLSIHSFSPVLNGARRPWSIGVCYGDDKRVAHALLPQLSKIASGPIGDNEPYSIEDHIDYSLPKHASQRGLPHVMLEIRRDKIESAQGARQYADLIYRAWLASKATLP